MKSKTVHAAHPNALSMLRDLGVTHLSIANNHAWDFGHAGLVETRRLAEEAGFAVSGAGIDLNEAIAPAVKNGVALIAVDAGPTPDWAIAGVTPGVAPLRIRHNLGLPHKDIQRLNSITKLTGEDDLRRNRIRVGFDRPLEGRNFYGLSLSESDFPVDLFEADPDDLARLLAIVSAARAQAETILVSVHYHNWGPNWSQPPDWLSTICETLAKSGVDAVLCTGPTVAFPTKPIGTSIAATSLGSLVFHTNRGSVYDALGMPVWAGMALVGQDNSWREFEFGVLKPGAT